MSKWNAFHFAEGIQTPVLNEVSLTTIDSDSCRVIFRNQVTKNMICAYGQGKDTCQVQGKLKLFKHNFKYFISLRSKYDNC